MAANLAIIDELNSDVDEVYSLISKFRKSWRNINLINTEHVIAGCI